MPTIKSSDLAQSTQVTPPPQSNGGTTRITSADLAPQTTAVAPSATPDTKGPLDKLADWGAETFHRLTPEDEDKEAASFGTFLGKPLDRFVSNAGNAALRGAAALPAGAVDAVEGLFDPDSWTLGGSGRKMQQHVDQAKQSGTMQTIAPGQPVPEPSASDYADYGSDLLGDAGLGYLTGKMTEGLLKTPGALKEFVRGPIHEPIVGSNITPLQRFNSAKNLGVNLDAADATNSPLLGNVKRLGENSLTGGHLYDKLKAGNTGALTDSMDSFLNDLYSGDREAGGREIQDALRRDQGGLRTGAEQGFDQLTEQTKGQPVKSAPAVGIAAKNLLDPIAKLADKYPSLAPKQTMGVLSDLSRIGAKPKVKPLGFLDGPDSEFAVPSEPAKPTPVSWSDLQRLRSGTHDLTTSNPDLVKSQAIAPLQQMTSTLDDAMTNSASGLNPAQEAIFRDANAKWKDMKATYDDPSSPLHSAVRTDNPSSLFTGVGPRTPENARNLISRLSPLDEAEQETTPALGALRRGTVESALRPTNDGAPNFKTFGTQLNRIPADYRAELFNTDQNETLRDFNHTSNVLAKDFNPSGSAKQGQKIGEAMAMIPFSGLPALQYVPAKAMTSPRAVDWLMASRRLPNPLAAKIAGVGALESARRRDAQR